MKIDFNPISMLILFYAISFPSLAGNDDKSPPKQERDVVTITPYVTDDYVVLNETRLPHQQALLVAKFAYEGKNNPKFNQIVNYDGEGGTPISSIDSGLLLERAYKNIDDTAKEWGMSREEVMVILGGDPSQQDPVCGVSAQNIIRLFLDTVTTGRAKVELPFTGKEELLRQVENRDSSKNYILMINDPNMGHAYTVDIPAQSSENTRVYLYQSDAGFGVTSELSLSDWMSVKGKQAIPLDRLIDAIDEFRAGVCNQQLIADVFDINSDPNAIHSEKQTKFGEEIRFSMDAYDPSNAKLNMDMIESNLY